VEDLCNDSSQETSVLVDCDEKLSGYVVLAQSSVVHDEDGEDYIDCVVLESLCQPYNSCPYLRDDSLSASLQKIA
jgi:hypothetical protein